MADISKKQAIKELLHMIQFNPYVYNDYDSCEAVKLAIEIMSDGKAEPKSALD